MASVINYAPPPEKVGVNRAPRFAFIDADNVYRSFCNELKRAKLDKKADTLFDLRGLFKGYERCYVYYAEKQDAGLPNWIKTLQKSDGYILRLSRATEKRGRTKQEGVDVQLAIEAIQHSYRGTMASCGLFSGDGDFLPLIDALTNNGTFVTVHDFSNPDEGAVTPELRNRADRYSRLGRASILGCLPQTEFKHVGGACLPPEISEVEPTSLVLDEIEVKLWKLPAEDAEGYSFILIEREGTQGFWHWRFKSLLALRSYFRLADSDVVSRLQNSAN